MYQHERIPDCRSVGEWHRIASLASPVITSFFLEKPRVSIPLSEDLVVSQSSFDPSLFSTTRFSPSGEMLHHITYKTPRRHGALDMHDIKKRSYVCPYETLVVFGVSLTTVVDEVKEACLLMDKNARPKDGLTLPYTLQQLLSRPTFEPL